MKNKYLITFSLTFVSILFFAETLQAQRLIGGGKPKESIVAGFDEAFCVQLSGNFRVCRATDAEREKPKFAILKKNKVLTVIDSSYFRSACCEAEDFLHFAAI